MNDWQILDSQGQNLLHARGISGRLSELAPECRGDGWKWTAGDLRFCLREAKQLGAEKSSAVAKSAVAMMQDRIRENYATAAEKDQGEMPWDHEKAQAFLDIPLAQVSAVWG